jgi:uncharacterized membrane protein YraQ (UPF0718 family)
MDTTVGFILLMYILVAVIPQLVPVFLFGVLIQSVLPLEKLLILPMNQMLVITFSSQRSHLLCCRVPTGYPYKPE